MGKYWKYFGEYDAETTTYTAFAGGGGSSPYTPTSDGTLKALRLVVGADAATTLTEHVVVKLTCDKFTPNAIEAGISGNGLATAPAFKPPPADWPVDQPVASGVPIVMEGKNVTADTPVGVSVHVYGLIET